MALELGCSKLTSDFFKVRRVKVEGEIRFIVHGCCGVNSEAIRMSCFFNKLISRSFINSFAAVNKEVSYGAHETLRVFDVWPVFGFLEGVNAAPWEVSNDDRAIIRLDVGGSGATDE